MKEYVATARIRAAPEAAWSVLADGPRYKRWNSEAARVDGRLSLGEKIEAHVVQHSCVARADSVRVTTFDLM